MITAMIDPTMGRAITTAGDNPECHQAEQTGRCHDRLLIFYAASATSAFSRGTDGTSPILTRVSKAHGLTAEIIMGVM